MGSVQLHADPCNAPRMVIPSLQAVRTAPVSCGKYPRPIPFVMRPRPDSQPAVKPTQPHVNVTARFGQKLRRMRLDRGLTQTRMAEELGIDRTFLSDLECGRKSLTLPTLATIARGLGMTLSELLKGI